MTVVLQAFVSHVQLMLEILVTLHIGDVLYSQQALLDACWFQDKCM